MGMMSSFDKTTTAGAAKASPSDIRRTNRSLIFKLLFPSQHRSRADLGRLTGLSRVAVSDVVSDMLDEGLVSEIGYAANPTGKGKRGALLGIDTSRLKIISIDLSQSQLIQGAVTDLLGVPQECMEIALGPDNHVEADAIVQLVDQLRTDLDVNDVLGIGIVVAGVVQGGMVTESTMLGWHDVNLGALIERQFNVPVIIVNDAIAAMLTERFFGQAGHDFIFTTFGQGVGAATLIHDTPIVGDHHAAGEIGHISIDLDGPECPCGKRGCLETMISVNALRERMRHQDARGRADVIRGAGSLFASAMAMPVGLLDIADVCVAGPPDIINNTFLEAAQQRFDAVTGSTFHVRTVIRRCQVGGNLTLRGGAISVIHSYING